MYFTNTKNSIIFQILSIQYTLLVRIKLFEIKNGLKAIKLILIQSKLICVYLVVY